MKKKIIKIFLLPIAILIVIIKPLIFIRFFLISNNTLGHFLMDTYIKIAFANKKENNKSLFHLNIFYLKSEKTVNNKILEMWRKEVNIFPDSLFLKSLRELMYFLKKKEIFFPSASWYENIDLVHTYKLKNFRLSEEDDISSINFLKSLKINIRSNDKWICIYNRDNEWTKNVSGNKNELKLNEYRNFDIKKCIDSINFFLEKGYYVFRVGKISEERLKINNKKFYDFTNRINIPEEVLIYLLSNCELSFGGETGLRWIPLIFKKKVAVFNSPEIITETLCHYNTNIPFFPKKILSKKKKDFLNLKEIF